MQIYVADKFVLLKPIGQQKTKSGLITPQTQGDKPQMGIIYKIGRGKQPFSTSMKVGDTVIYKKYMSNEIEIIAIGEIVNPIGFEDLVTLLRERE